MGILMKFWNKSDESDVIRFPMSAGVGKKASLGSGSCMGSRVPGKLTVHWMPG
jgi:CRISPR/Cas system endoribonuclease Cas6 (RAMP superfamily)